MSMNGHYLALDEDRVQTIIDGGENILDIDAHEEDALDIDKAWQAILYLLCGQPFEGEPPMGYVVPMMTAQVIDQDLDYAAFYLYPQQVQAASNYLNSLDEATVKSQYHFQEMAAAEVYPIFDADEDGEEFYEYIYSYLLDLKQFYNDAAAQNKGVVFYVL